MTRFDPPAWDADDVETEAARWFARHRADDVDDAQRAAFDRWVSDPAAAAAYARTEALWDALGGLDAHPEIVAIQTRDARGRRRGVWPVAAGLAATAACATALWLVPRGDPPAAPTLVAQHFQSGVGQRMPVVLADGSIVTLDTDSAVTVRMERARRGVTLDRGRAFFKVAKAPDRPFVVRAAGQSVTAVGTSFSVAADRRGVDVVLVEGRVRVVPAVGRATGNRVEMVAGDRLSVSADGQWMLRRIDTARATSWLDGRLMFDDARLGDIAAALNRYSKRRIVFADADVADERMSTVLRTDDAASFTAAIEAMKLGKVRRDGAAGTLTIDRP